MSAFNPGDTLTISTASYKCRRFTVLESNGHRTKLRGAKGAHRVLVKSETTEAVIGGVYREEWHSIHEDDGEKNRGRPCTVDQVEHQMVEGPMASVRSDAPVKPDVRRHRSITAMELAMLMKCETARDVAEWVIQRDVTHACVTQDQHAADNGAAMKLYLSSLEIRRLSAEAAA